MRSAKQHTQTGNFLRRGRRTDRGASRMQVEALERRLVLANAVPTTVLNLPAQALIGSTVDFTVGFSNGSASQTGYGPYIDLDMPAPGVDGNDGLTFGSATYLGAPVTSTVLTFNASGQATHPYAKDASGNPLVITGTPGDQLVVLLLPFGSVTPGQPQATVDVTANLSDKAPLGQPLTVKVDGGFEFGNVATGSTSIVGSQSSSQVDPTLFTVKTTYQGPEQETATGPNFEEQYLVTASIAPGQTISNFALTDLLPAGEQFVAVDSVSANGSTNVTRTSTPSTTTPGGSLTETFNQVVGTGGPNDVSVLYTFYVPRDDSSSNQVLNLNNGDFEQETDQASATGSWTPINSSEPTVTVNSNVATDTITAKSVAVQKTVVDLTHPGMYIPGDVLQYTINFEVSDFFAFQNAIATDILSDGQEVNAEFAPTLSFHQAGVNTSAAFDSENYSVGAQNTTTGTTTINFNVSAELAARGYTNGQLLGGSIPGGGTGGPIPSANPADGGTTGTIVYQTVVLQQFNYNYPSGEKWIDEGDFLTNSVSMTGDVLSYTNLSDTEQTQTDGSGTSVSIPRGNLSESIYAINGNTDYGAAKVAAGDTVTYELEYTLPTSNIEDLDISSYLPLPIFNATTVTSFDPVVSATAPASGSAQFGPNDTYYGISGIVPTLTSNATANSLDFDYGTYHDPAQNPSTVDILFTVTASNQPFADGLFLTNQAHESEGSTNNGGATANAIVQLEVTEPVLSVTKGIVAVNDPGATVTPNPYGFDAPGSSGPRFDGTINSNALTANPITGGVSNIQAGDLVTFAIVVNNTGSGLNGAFDLTLADSLPAGFVIPSGGLNLKVTDGAGNALSVSNVGEGSGLFDQGILVKNPTNGVGTLAAYDATSGHNVLVVTYDLQAASTVTPNETITNTASLDGYSASEGGPNFLSAPETATATATTEPVSMTKSITATNQGFTSGTKLAIGEIATYDVTVTIPEGETPDAELVDTLPAGLGLVGVESISASTDDLSTSQGSWSSVAAAATVGSNGSSVSFNFGNIFNDDPVNTDTDTLTIVYQVAALNVASNTNGSVVQNSADFSYTGGSTSASASATIVVPLLKLTATANKSSAQAGDTVTYTLTLSNTTSNGSGTNAYNINLSDVLPTGVDYQIGSLTYASGLVPSLNDSGGAPVITYSSFPLGDSSTVTFQGILDTSTGPYQTLTNTANLTYTTLPSNITTTQSPYNSVATERTGDTSDPGGTANNLKVSKTDNITTVDPTLTKSIVSTSLSSVTGNNLAVGETVQYQVVVNVPDGTMDNAVLTDDLPIGMAFVSLDSLSLADPISDTGDPAVPTIGTNGDSLTMNFGTLTNSNLNSADQQTIVVTYTAVVLNTASNQNGTTLQNSVSFATNGGSASASAPVQTVVLPLLTLTNTPSMSHAQAGDTVTYTVTIANEAANGSTEDAYNVNLTDLVPTGMSYNIGSLQAVDGGYAATTVNDSGGSPVITFSDLPLNSSSSFTFTATVESSTGPYQTLTNTANASFTTLPGDATDPESEYNSVSTERTGDSGDPGGAVNNLDVSAPAQVSTVLPAVTKSVIATSLSTTTGTNVAIGETVQYQVVVTIPDGTSANATFTDTLPAGLAFVSLDSIAASEPLSWTGNPAAPTIGANGSSMTLNFGTITNSNLDSEITQTITVDYTAVVLNTAGNKAGDQLDNSVVFAVQGGEQTATTPVTIVEPVVGVTLSPSPTTGDAGGSAITFTLTVAASTGTGADAYNVNLSDILPSGYSYVNDSLHYADGQDPDSLSDAGGNIAATFDDMAPGTTSQLIFQAELTGNTNPGEQVGDTANVTYTSLPTPPSTSESAYNTLGVSRTGNTANTGGAANTYDATANASVTVNSNTIAGNVFEDQNDDGLENGSDTGIANVSLLLTGHDNLGNVVSLTTTTNSEGAYSFNTLRPGTYAVTMTPPSGYLDGKDTAGTPFGGNVSDDAISGIAIALGTNAPGAGYNFAELRPASVAGNVYSDLNDNGVMNGGEPGIAGVTLTLTGTNDLGDVVNVSQNTNAAGQYDFSNLRPGSYTVTETQPAGWLQGKNSAGNSGGTFAGDVLNGVTLTENKADTNVDFGELAPASINGTVYLDSNNDGAKQTGEPGVPNALVTLTGTDDNGDAVDTAVLSGAGGVYSFTNLRPGTYTVTETTPSGFVNGKAGAGSLGGNAATPDVVSAIPVTAGENGVTYNLGVLQPATIAGYMYIDASDNGVMSAADAPVVGGTVTLTGTDQFGNEVNLTTTTLADGSYAFGNLEPGTYTVTGTVPDGDLSGKATAGTLGGNASTPDQVSSITVTQDATASANNLAILQPSSLSGFVYLDANDDGVKEGGEAGVAGVCVRLTGTDDRGDAVNLMVTTGDDGSFSFGDLRPGTYALSAPTPSGDFTGKATPGTPGATAGSGTLSAITLNEGVSGVNNDFGLLTPASLGGTVYLDANDDGTLDNAETGIPGVTITLTGTNDQGSVIDVSTVTGEDGTYLFTDLRPGTYALSETTPAGYFNSGTTAGSLGGTATTAQINSIAVASGNSGINDNFGLILPSSIAGEVYDDANDDGVIDGGETGIAGVTITLTGVNDQGTDVSTSTTTADDGSYSFGNLRPGRYTVTITPPSGYLDGKEALGTDGGMIGTHKMCGIVLSQNVNTTGYDFGELLPSSIAGEVYHDANDDGVIDDGETGIAGVTVTLTGTDDNGDPVSTSTTTGDDGTYAFNNLRPGTYAVILTPPSGYLDGKESVGTDSGVIGTHIMSGIVFGQNVNANGYNFGELLPSTVSGYVYNDVNDNGVKDSGEVGLAGSTVTLTGVDDNGDPVSLSMTTADDGSFSFPGLRPSNLAGYTLAATTPAGYLPGQTAIGSAGGSVSNRQITTVVPDGANDVNNDFAALVPSSLAGTVYDDLNDNGEFEGGEPGVAGVTVKLTGINDLGNHVCISEVTAANGTYDFTNLRPGTYTITKTPPAGYLDGFDTIGTPGGVETTQNVFSSIVLAAGVNGAANNFAELTPSSLSGYVYSDLFDDALYHPGWGIGGVCVRLTGTDDRGDAVNLMVTTQDDGSYSFGDLRPGDYTLFAPTPNGYLSDQATAGTPGGTASVHTITDITLAQGYDGVENDFGEFLPATLAGFVYNDVNDNGILDAGESGIPNVTVTLTGYNDQETFVNVTTTTGDDGSYAFNGLRPGVYTVTETDPAGYLDGKVAAGPDGGNVAGRAISGVRLSPRQIAMANNFGELLPSSLAGTLYLDMNDDGLLDDGETGASNLRATVTLTGTDDNGNPVDLTTSTSLTGTYAFTNLRPGDYTLSETTPAGLLTGQSTAGTQGGTTGLGTESQIILAQDVNGVNNNFALVPPAALSGFVYSDANDDGVMENGESGLAGVTVTLTGTNDLGDTISLSTTTAANGSYAFDGLRPGTYAVAATTPTGYLTGTATPGTDGGTVDAGQITSVALSPGLWASANDFGELLPASLAGFVYHDVNDNGVMNAGETGLAGVSVTLTGIDDNGNPVDVTTTTGANGAYVFNDLRPGDYSLRDTTPSGYTSTAAAAGTLGGTAGTTCVMNVTVAAGNAGANYDFGALVPAGVFGFVYDDANDDGKIDNGETGIADVSVTLTGIDDRGDTVDLTTTTADDGSYDFLSLRPGTYAITIAPPTGYFDGQIAVGSAGGTVATNAITTITLGDQTVDTGNDFAELLPSSLSGFIFNDANDDGLLDGPDAGIAGVNLTLTGTNDLGAPVSLSTTTGIDGSYTFTGLRPGTYTVAEASVAGELVGKTTVGVSGGNAGSQSIGGVALPQGTADTGNNFAWLQPAALSGFVYNDVNDNGTLDGADVGVGGVTINLTGTNDLGAPVQLSTITANDGSYSFANLRPGTYTLTETRPAGDLDGATTAGSLGGGVGVDTVSGIALTPAATSVGNDFGVVQPASVSGFVYVDANDNGVLDGGETGVAGVTLTLTGTTDLDQSVSLTTTTAANGGYAFNGLRPGTYRVAETDPSDYLDGKVSPGSGGGTVDGRAISALTLVPNEAASGNDFAELSPSILSGVVYLDANNNGIVDAGESGVGNVTVTLTGTDDNGDPISLSTTTTPNGAYSFTNLRPGSYTLTETTPSGDFTGKATAGTEGATPGAGTLSGITLAEGVNGANNLFGVLPPATLSGFVYNDANDNGVREADETGVPGVNVTLTGTDDLGNPVNLSVTTGVDGSYSFPNLRPGGYTVAETDPSGYLDGQVTPGIGGGTVAGRTITVATVTPGLIDTGNNFAELLAASLSGFVYVDANNSGVFNSGDAGIPGVTVTLTGTDDLGDPLSVATTTGADGSYAFAGLRPGSYTVAETDPSGYLDGQVTPGIGGGTVDGRTIGGLTLTSAENATGNDFASLIPGTLAGIVYRDANDSGQYQASDVGVGGVTVTLTGTDDQGDPVSLSTVTANDGSYSFGNLRPGTYGLSASTPAGSFDSSASAGTLGGNADAHSIALIDLTTGAAGTAYDFGEILPASIAGFVYDDANDDGVLDRGEIGIAGVTLTLTGTNDLGNSVDLTATTGIDGSYDFSGLRPGTYAVAVAPVAGYLAGDVTVGNAGGSAGSQQVSGVALAQNVAGNGYNFAELQPASLSGYVYDDLNDDGVMDAGDRGLAGVTVTLTGTNDLGAAVDLTTTTLPDGSYSFANLRPGVYTLTETRPAQALDGATTAGSLGGVAGDATITQISVAQGATGTGNDFGLLPPASIAGYVYDDDNNDGVKDGTEIGAANATVTLTGTNDLEQTVTLTTTTNADGNFVFSGLRPGTYTLTETPLPGFTNGRDTAGTAGGTVGAGTVSAIRLPAGISATNYAFAELGAAIAGTVFIDLHGTGVYQNGDPLVGGAIVKLFNADGQVVGTAVTAADGTYSFPHFPAGDYTVQVYRPNPSGGWVTETKNVVVAAGAQVRSFFPAAPDSNTSGSAAISGTVFADRNDNGVRDPNEPGVAGVKVTLTGTDSTGHKVSLVTTTATGGGYAFPGLNPGTYTVTENTPTGYLNDKVSPPARTITLVAGQTATPTFGILPPSTLAGTVYLDAGNTGVIEPNDFGIAHVTVTLTGTNDLGQKIDLSTTTDANGNYEFNGLRPGVYTVTRGASPLFNNGSADVGTMGGAAQGLQINGVSLIGGESAAQYDFGQKIKPTCVLATPAFKTILAQGPHPTGPSSSSSTAKVALLAKTFPNLAYWVPTLAARLGIKS